MTGKMKTVCIGRLLIDLPEEAQVELRRPSIDGFNIDASNESDEAFKARVAAREAEIRATPDRLGGNKNMESVREVKTDSGLVGKIFVHGRYVTEGTQLNGLDLERYRYEGVALEGYVHADGISIDLTAEKYDPDLLENLPKLISKLVANPGNRIPTEPGFCIDRAYFRDPLTADQTEQIFMSAELPSHPDLTIGLISMAGAKKTDKRGLLERSDAAWSKGPLALAIKLRFTKLRAAARTIGGLTGDELAVRVYELNFSTRFGLQWEVRGTEDNVFVPYLLLEMVTGKGEKEPVPSSLSQEAALSLWDKISSSIRLRPSEPPKRGAAGPAGPPIGA